MSYEASTMTTQVKEAMMIALQNLPATGNGTEIQAIVGSGQDAFDQYPVIRVIPTGVERNISADTSYRDYQMNFVISIYLDMGDEIIPDEEVIATICEIGDNIIERLDQDDWLPNVAGLALAESVSSSTIDTIQTKNGTVLYCDIIYPVSYRTSIA